MNIKWFGFTRLPWKAPSLSADDTQTQPQPAALREDHARHDSWMAGGERKQDTGEKQTTKQPV